jgi:hypothetical protein
VSSDFDFSELNRLAADLGDVPKKSGPLLRKAIEVTARNVKDSWRSKLKGSQTLPGLPAAVSYDVSTFQGFGVSILQAEIGFDKTKPQGALGNVSEYGTPTVAPRGFGHAALQENQADFEKGIGIAVDQALGEVGL